jgi:hypothetical protein
MAQPRKYDYAAVAACWHSAVDAGDRPATVIGSEFGVSEPMAGYLIGIARKHGLIPPSGRRPRHTGPDGRPDVVHPPAPAITGACPTCGTVFVPSFAPRERRSVDPSRRPVPPADRSAGPVAHGGQTSMRRVLACDDCEFECDSDRPRLLIRHCIEVHGRPPTSTERIPARPTTTAATTH